MLNFLCLIRPVLNLLCSLQNPFGISLAVQGLRLWPSNAGDMGSIPDWVTKIPHAPCCSQKKKKKKANPLLPQHFPHWVTARHPPSFPIWKLLSHSQSSPHPLTLPFAVLRHCVCRMVPWRLSPLCCLCWSRKAEILSGKNACMWSVSLGSHPSFTPYYSQCDSA